MNHSPQIGERKDRDLASEVFGNNGAIGSPAALKMNWMLRRNLCEDALSLSDCVLCGRVKLVPHREVDLHCRRGGYGFVGSFTAARSPAENPQHKVVALTSCCWALSLPPGGWSRV